MVDRVKEITRDRVLRAAKRVQETRKKRNKFQGLLSMTGEYGLGVLNLDPLKLAQPEAEAVKKKAELELLYLGEEIPKSPEACRDIVDRHSDFHEHYNKWLKVVAKIGARAGISGLAKSKTKFRQYEFSYVLPHDCLGLTAIDLGRLMYQRNEVVEFFLYVARRENLAVRIRNNRGEVLRTTFTDAQMPGPSENYAMVFTIDDCLNLAYYPDPWCQKPGGRCFFLE